MKMVLYLREWRARNRAKSSVVNSTVTSVNPTQATTTSEINQSEGGVVGTSELSAKKKREDTNKYLREWRARKKAKSTDGCNTISSGTPMQSTIMTPEEHNEDGAVQQSSICDKEKKRLERNKYQREYRAKKKAEKANVNIESVVPTISNIGTCSFMDQFTQYTSYHTDKENVEPDDSMDLLHRNDTYQRKGKLMEPFSVGQTQQSPFPDEIMHDSSIQEVVVGQDMPDIDYIEFDNMLFEPQLLDFHVEGNVETTQTCDVVDSDDEELQKKENDDVGDTLYEEETNEVEN
uniref:Uncharacterized protein n=1 Tax=Oryza meridionalis TaxID=40149 RepID=A0A0E0EUP4_9ORYZ